MIPGRRRLFSSFAAATVAATATLGACAQATAPAGSVVVRLLVKIAQPSEDGAAIAAAAARETGVTVRYAAATSFVWHALNLECRDAAQCDAAIVRLRAAKATFPVVERDERKQAATSSPTH